MEAKIKSATFLAEICGRASDPPTAPITQKYHFFDAAPKGLKSFHDILWKFGLKIWSNIRTSRIRSYSWKRMRPGHLNKQGLWLNFWNFFLIN